MTAHIRGGCRERSAEFEVTCQPAHPPSPPPKFLCRLQHSVGFPPLQHRLVELVLLCGVASRVGWGVK